MVDHPNGCHHHTCTEVAPGSQWPGIKIFQILWSEVYGRLDELISLTELSLVCTPVQCTCYSLPFHSAARNNADNKHVRRSLWLFPVLGGPEYYTYYTGTKLFLAVFLNYCILNMALVPLTIEGGTITNSSHVCCRHYSQQHCAFVSDVLVSPPPWREILSRGATHNCIADKYHLTVMFTFVGASCSPFGRSIGLFLLQFPIKIKVFPL